MENLFLKNSTNISTYISSSEELWASIGNFVMWALIIGLITLVIVATFMAIKLGIQYTQAEDKEAFNFKSKIINLLLVVIVVPVAIIVIVLAGLVGIPMFVEVLFGV